MCGIHVTVSRSLPREIPTHVQKRLRNRGPDHLATHATCCCSGNDQDELTTTHLGFTSTVLALRGHHIAPQPFVDQQTGSVFCWNGEAWRIRHADVSGNDGEAIANLLTAACQSAPSARQDAILKVLRSIDGPFAFTFFDKPSKRLYFGRDRLGRRSLLLRLDQQGLVLSSVAEAKDPEWKEVEADGVYALDLAQSKPVLPPVMKLEWLQGENTAHVVSERLHRAFDATRYPIDYSRLTDQDLRHRHFQYFYTQPTEVDILDANISRGSPPAADRVAEIACSQRTSAP